MALAQTPNKQDWYVYQLKALGIPFYVGIGRAARASDRLRWVCSQIKRELARKPAKWSLHTKVIKALILSPVQVEIHYVRKHLRRSEAIRIELRTIRTLLSKGFVLANEQHNHRPPTDLDVIKFIRKRSKTAGRRPRA